MDNSALEKVVEASSKSALQAMTNIREITSRALASEEGLTPAMISEIRRNELVWDMEMDRYVAAAVRLGIPIEKDRFASCF